MDKTDTEANGSMMWAIVGLVVLALIGLWWFTTHGGAASKGVQATSTSPTSSSGASMESSTANNSNAGVQITEVKPAEIASASHQTIPSGGEAISMQEQPAGSSATVASVTLTKPSWVAIKDADSRVLGAAWFDASGRDLEAPLLRATKPGIIYYAVIFVDDGDKQFDLHKDSIVVDSTGNAINMSFLAQ